MKVQQISINENGADVRILDDDDSYLILSCRVSPSASQKILDIVLSELCERVKGLRFGEEVKDEN